MNIIANNVASKLFVAFVAASMLFTLATPAKAATTEELQAQIEALMAQIAGLTSSTDSGAGSAACTFTRALTVGSQGADVNCLQNYLTSTGHYKFSGGSTGYFGAVTASAVAAWQGANGVAPAVGYFGPVSQAKYSALVAMSGGDDSTDDSDDDSTDDSDDDSTSGDLSGEASWTNLTIDSASDDEVDEGDEDAEIAVATFEFEDGDAMITRIDVAIDGAGDVWDVLDEVSLWVDGDEIARSSASDEDDYQDEDTGTLRFSGLDLVAMEDEELEVTIAATFQGSVDSDDQGSFNVSVDSFRWVDGDDVTETETGTDFDLEENVTFTLGEAGQDDELIVKTSDTDPDGTTLQLEDDAKSDWFTVFAFDLDSDDSANDLELNEVSVILDTASSTGAVTAFTYADAIDDVELVIDGVTIDDLVVAAAATTTLAGFDDSRVLRFDVDGDVTIDAGDRVTAELKVRFKSLAVATDEGSTIQGRVTSANAKAIDAEGADTLEATQLSGAATGDEHTLRTAGVNVEAGDIEATVTTGDNDDDDYATYSIELEVTAFEQDVYISTTPGTSLSYTLEDGSGTATSSGSRTVTITSTGDEVSGTFEITEGSTETITVEVTYDPSVTTSTAARLQIETITFGSTSGTPTGQSWTASPDEDYRTSTVTIVN